MELQLSFFIWFSRCIKFCILRNLQNMLKYNQANCDLHYHIAVRCHGKCLVNFFIMWECSVIFHQTRIVLKHKNPLLYFCKFRVEQCSVSICSQCLNYLQIGGKFEWIIKNISLMWTFRSYQECVWKC